MKIYHPAEKRKVLIVFDDIIADMEANEKLSPIVTELFLRVRKLQISFAFISQSYFKVPKSYKTKRNTLLYYETNSIKSFV